MLTANTLNLRPEFLAKHMRATAIELSNKQNSGWAQRPDPSDLLEMTYPTADVQRALDAISTAAAGRPVVFIGQRGHGKSHIMAVLHHAFGNKDPVQAWAKAWGAKLASAKLQGVVLQKGFFPISETMSNQEYPSLWDLIFDRHPKGAYFKGCFAASGTMLPAKSLLQDMFNQQRTALILDELQTWFDGLQDDPSDHGPKRRQWAFNFLQILSELAKDRPDLLSLVVSVRDSTTEAYRQVHRVGPMLIDFKGETARRGPQATPAAPLVSEPRQLRRRRDRPSRGSLRHRASPTAVPRPLVVNGDADQVIVLRADSDRGWVAEMGTIDQPRVRDAIVETLDGGREALAASASEVWLLTRISHWGERTRLPFRA